MEARIQFQVDDQWLKDQVDTAFAKIEAGEADFLPHTQANDQMNTRFAEILNKYNK